MNTTTKPTEHANLPKRNPKTGRFEKAAGKVVKPDVKPIVKPAADKSKKS